MELSGATLTWTGNDLGANWCTSANDRTPFDFASPGDANEVCPVIQ